MSRRSRQGPHRMLDEVVADTAASTEGLRRGRVLGSRVLYRTDHPRHLVIFNAVLATPDGLERWTGDLDLTDDEPALARLAARLGTPLWVLREDGPMGRRRTPERWTAVGVIAPGGRLEQLPPGPAPQRDLDGRLAG